MEMALEMANAAKIAADLKKELEELVELAKKKITKSDLDNIGETVVTEMKALISKGISPIEGRGRFAGYKNADDPRGYPLKLKKKYPQKRARPVNLELSGKFLRALTFRSNATRKSVEVGFFDQKSIDKESGHRDGVNTQPERPIVPRGTSENLARSIVLKIETVVQSILDKIKV